MIYTPLQNGRNFCADISCLNTLADRGSEVAQTQMTFFVLKWEKRGDIFQSPLRRLLIVLGSCSPFCTINNIICTCPSQPGSPWAIVFPSGVTALGLACHACSPLHPSVGTGLAGSRWDVLAFGPASSAGGTGLSQPPQQAGATEQVHSPQPWQPQHRGKAGREGTG